MNLKFTTRLTSISSTLVLLAGLSTAAAAQQATQPTQQPAAQAKTLTPAAPQAYRAPQARVPQVAPQGYRAPMPYNNGRFPMQRPMPNGPMPMAPGYGYNPYMGPQSMPGFNGPFNGPFNGNRFANRPFQTNRMPWGGYNNRRGFGRGMPFESNFTPWSHRFWDEIGEGGQNPFRNSHRWFQGKDGAANMWDDLLNAPSDMGRMPGGWTAPSISVPNPIDVGDEFSNAARDMPDEIRNQMDNIDIQTW